MRKVLGNLEDATKSVSGGLYVSAPSSHGTHPPFVISRPSLTHLRSGSHSGNVCSELRIVLSREVSELRVGREGDHLQSLHEGPEHDVGIANGSS